MSRASPLRPLLFFAAKSVRQAALHDLKFSLIANGRIIKRRSVDGQQTHELMTEISIPDVPVNTERVRLAEPDSITALLIALGFADPGSEVAKGTLDFLRLYGTHVGAVAAMNATTPAPSRISRVRGHLQTTLYCVLSTKRKCTNAAAEYLNG